MLLHHAQMHTGDVGEQGGCPETQPCEELLRPRSALQGRLTVVSSMGSVTVPPIAQGTPCPQNSTGSWQGSLRAAGCLSLAQCDL